MIVLFCLFLTDIMSPPATAAAAATDGGSPSGSIPRWVYALAIGVPVAAALAYILFGPSGDSKARSKKAKKPKAADAEASVAAPATVKPVAEVKPVAPENKTPAVEIEDCPEGEGPTDPLEKAMAAKNKGTANQGRAQDFSRGGRSRMANLALRVDPFKFESGYTGIYIEFGSIANPDTAGTGFN